MKKTLYKKMLVTHDGSKLAATVLPHVDYLARMLQTKILLLRVIESVSQEITHIAPGITPSVPTIGEMAVEVVEKDKQVAQQHLELTKKEFEDKGIPWIETRVEEGDPGEQIVYVAKKEHVDLIVMATHGRSGLGRVLLGSVADYVVRHASCPVLLVHPQEHKTIRQ